MRLLHVKSFLFTCLFLFVSKVRGTCTYTPNTQYTCGSPQNTGTLLNGGGHWTRYNFLQYNKFTDSNNEVYSLDTGNCDTYWPWYSGEHHSRSKYSTNCLEAWPQSIKPARCPASGNCIWFPNTEEECKDICDNIDVCDAYAWRKNLATTKNYCQLYDGCGGTEKGSWTSWFNIYKDKECRDHSGCPGGQENTDTGSTVCANCASGTYREDGSSSGCVENTNYSKKINANKDGLELCPAGQDSAASSGATCADCAAGYYRAENSPDACQANNDLTQVIDRFGVVSATCSIDEDSSSGTCQPCGVGEGRTPSMTACAPIIEVCTNDGSTTLTRANMNTKYWEDWLDWFDKDVRVCNTVTTIAADVFTGSLDADGMADGCTPARMKEIQDNSVFIFGPSGGFTLDQLYTNGPFGPTCSDNSVFGYKLTNGFLTNYRAYSSTRVFNLNPPWHGTLSDMVNEAANRVCYHNDLLPTNVFEQNYFTTNFGGNTCMTSGSGFDFNYFARYTNYLPKFGGRHTNKFSAPIRSIYGANVQTIEANAFQYCDLMQEALFPIASSYGANAFKDTEISSIQLLGGATYNQAAGSETFESNVNVIQTASVAHVCTNDGSTTLSLASSNYTAALTKAIICDTVEIIDSDLFTSSAIISSMTEIELGSNVHTINANAFQGSLIASVTMPATLTTVGANAFANSQLNSVTFAAGAVDIGDSAFKNTALTSVNIPDGSTVGANAFANSQLNSVTFSGAVDIGANAFVGTSLNDVTITAATSIGDNAFENTPLATATIGAIGTIGDSAFAGTSLTAVTIDSVNILAYNAFDSGVAVQLNAPPASIDNYAITAPTLADYSQQQIVTHYKTTYGTC